MKTMISRLVLVVMALGASTIDATAETVTASIGGADRVYTFIADTSQSARMVAMWSKKNSDLDLYAYWLDAEEPVLVAASFASGERLELAELGVLGDGFYSVVVSKFSGPKTKFTLNVSTAGSEVVSLSGLSDRAGGRLAYAGDLELLAADDPYFASMQRQLERVRRLKRSSR